MIPNEHGVPGLWAKAKDLQGVVGLEIQQGLLSRSAQLAKRVMDVALAIFGGLLVLPLILVLAVLVRLESTGPCFYAHPRVGRNGRQFNLWKLRTMVLNADQVLTQYLTANPAARDEWFRTQKLKHDPRVTRLGRFLRKSSLDELPQLWNVLKGDMSLVGPRPIVTAEIEKYGTAFEVYKKVKPGITGLWQISGRNDTSYDQRVYLDSYYVRNWSLWLDLYILVRTPWAVLLGKGAY